MLRINEVGRRNDEIVNQLAQVMGSNMMRTNTETATTSTTGTRTRARTQETTWMTPHCTEIATKLLRTEQHSCLIIKKKCDYECFFFPSCVGR